MTSTVSILHRMKSDSTEFAVDRATMIRVATGERTALGDLYDRYFPYLLALGERILGHRGEAEDVVHDVFVEAWQAAGQYDPSRGTVRTWLALRMRSRCLDRVRSPAVRRAVDLETARMEERPAGYVALTDVLQGRRLRAALEALPLQQRAVLELGYFEGLSSSEMAEALQVPIGTVKSRVAAAMRKVREAMEAETVSQKGVVS